jgi:hypothetical protein
MMSISWERETHWHRFVSIMKYSGYELDLGLEYLQSLFQFVVRSSGPSTVAS